MSNPSDTKFILTMGALIIGTIIGVGVWVGLVLTLVYWILRLFGPA